MISWSELPKSFKLFSISFVSLVLFVSIGYFSNKPNKYDSTEALNLKNAELVSKQELKKLDNGQLSPEEIQSLLNLEETSFDKRDKKTILEKNMIVEPEDWEDIKENNYIYITFDKKDRNVREIRKIMRKLNSEDFKYDLKIFYMNVPESQTAFAENKRAVVQKFRLNDDINSLGITEDDDKFQKITVLEEGQVTFSTDNYELLTNKKDERFYK